MTNNPAWEIRCFGNRDSDYKCDAPSIRLSPDIGSGLASLVLSGWIVPGLYSKQPKENPFPGVCLKIQGWLFKPLSHAFTTHVMVFKNNQLFAAGHFSQMCQENLERLSPTPKAGCSFSYDDVFSVTIRALSNCYRYRYRVQ